MSHPGAAEKIAVFDVVESTNDTAKRMAASGTEHGRVVIADAQTAGRGKHGRPFFSVAGGGLYMSFVLHPEKLRFKTPALITVLAAVLVCEAIEAVCGRAPGIKWVNDIVLDGKKICGILAEAGTDGNKRWMVVGIGVNCSIPTAAFPECLRQTAGSIFPEGGQSIARNHLAAAIINRMAQSGRYATKEILSRYEGRLTMLRKRVRVSAGRVSYEAEALGIDDAGGLIVQRDDGQILSLVAGEISATGPAEDRAEGEGLRQLR